MQYLRVMQRLDGKWDWTVEWQDHIAPTGYCRPWRDWNETLQQLSPAAYAQYVAEREKYHDHGHDTPEEAAACYRSYLLDHNLTLGEVSLNTQHRCSVCGEWTNLAARVDMQVWSLCPEHNTREQVEQLFTLTADTQIATS